MIKKGNNIDDKEDGNRRYKYFFKIKGVKNHTETKKHISIIKKIDDFLEKTK